MNQIKNARLVVDKDSKGGALSQSIIWFDNGRMCLQKKRQREKETGMMGEDDGANTLVRVDQPDLIDLAVVD
jgi:hypothetical protein